MARFRLLVPVLALSVSFAGAPLFQAQSGLKADKVDVDTRIEISELPFTIDSCGSYVLTRCLTGVAGSHGITISASDVTLDLNGYTLAGVPGSLDGIKVNPGFVQSYVFRNGVVRDWGGVGVNASGVRGLLLEDLSVRGSGGIGFRAGAEARIRGCHAVDNGSHGFEAGGGVLVNCVAALNDGDGMRLTGGLASNCSARQNTQTGFASFVGSCLLRNCTAELNGAGFNASGRACLEGCVAKDNGSGISIGDHSTAINCTASGSTNSGIVARENSTIADSTVSGNGFLGIDLDDGSSVRGSVARNNTAGGISARSNCSVIECLASDNTGTGISLFEHNLALRNRCDGNDEGLLTSGSHNRIESNDLSRNTTTGLRVGGVRNVVLCNTVHDNTANYVIGSLNAFGPIVDLSTGGDLSSLADPNNAHPWANFEY